MATTVFDPSEGPSAEQQAAETAALEQGEKIARMQQEDRERKFQQTEDENLSPELIGGKFKSQDDLLKAYNELQKKLGTSEAEQVGEAAEEATEVEEKTEVEELPPVFTNAAQQYSEKGELTEETIEELSKMDTRDLINQYMEFYTRTAQQQQQQVVDSQAYGSIIDSVGGQEAYGEMVQWASRNLDSAEIENYNQVTNSGNVAAIKFAVEALSNRYKAAEGQEAPLITGKQGVGKEPGFRSHAELARAIADPKYNNDPAYRQDVEDRLARSQDLL